MKTPKMIKTFALMAVLSPVAIQALSPSAIASEGLDDLKEQKAKSMEIMKEASTVKMEKIKVDKIDFQKQIAADQQKVREELNADLKKSIEENVKQSIEQVKADIKTEEAPAIEKQVPENDAPKVIVGKAERVELPEEIDMTKAPVEPEEAKELEQKEDPTVIVGKAERIELPEEIDLTEKPIESEEVAESEETEAPTVIVGKAEKRSVAFDETILTPSEKAQNEESADSLKKVQESEAQVSEQAKQLEKELEGEITEELVSKVQEHNKLISDEILYIELLEESESFKLSEEDREGLAGAKEVISSLELEVPEIAEPEVTEEAIEVAEEEAVVEEEVIAEHPEIERLRKQNKGLETTVCEQKSQIDLLGEEIEALKNAASPSMDVIGMMQQLMMMNMMMGGQNQISYAGNTVDSMGQMMAPMMMMQSMNMMMMQSMGLGMQQFSTRDMYSKVNATPQNIYNVDGNYYAGDYTVTNPMAPQAMAQQIPYQGAPWAFDFNNRQPSFENIKSERELEQTGEVEDKGVELDTDEMIS